MESVGEKMRDPKRISEMLDAIREVWEAHPDLRLCQLILVVLGKGYYKKDIFHVEDNELLLQIRKTKVRLEK